MNSKEAGFSVCLLLVCFFLFLRIPDRSCCLMLFHTQDIGKRLLNTLAPASHSPRCGTWAQFLGFHPRFPLHDTSLDFLTDLETPDSPCNTHLDEAQLLEDQPMQGRIRDVGKI